MQECGCRRRCGTPSVRIGFSLRQADVLVGGQPIRDHWQVLARRDLEQDRIQTRRTWLRGRKTGRDALLLSFAAAGQALDDSLAVGADTPTRIWCSTRARSRCARPCWPGTTTPTTPVGGASGGRRSTDGRRMAARSPGCWTGTRRRWPPIPWLDSWLAVVEIIPVHAPHLPSAARTAAARCTRG
jgi:hypothetical protein